MHLDEYTRHDAVGLAELVRHKKVSPSELVRAALGAIERVNPRLNAVIDTRAEQALALAESKLPEGPFTGVPFLVKDVGLHAAGVPTDLGSRLMRGLVAPHDTVLMARYRQAGLVLLGRTNAPEFGINAATEPVLHGPTRNPWDVSRSPGGSSGGSAAAVASGLVPVAYGNDGGGSIRIPASLCGIFGLKPTRGRISPGPDMAEALHGMGTEHVLTRSVRDSAAVLDATRGAEPGDAYHVTVPERPYVEELRRKPGRLRVALSRTAATGVPVSPECVAAVEDAARLCEQLGHEVVEAAPAYDAAQLANAVLTVWCASGAAMVDGLAPLTGRTPGPDTLEAATWAIVQAGRALKAVELEAALGVFNQVSRAVGGFFRDYDVALTPTVSQEPWKLGVLDMDTPRTAQGWLEHIFTYAPFTALQNVTGQPAMSVPLYWSGGGLPIGVQFAGRWGDEATLFRLAAQLEEARPWAGRLPPVHASRPA
ncbi:amidase [Myxococcaceae bacterium GXIMD 01537]